jgi:SAM-dependent methyltransferase
VIESWLGVLGCPQCRGRLDLEGQDTLRCQACDEAFGFRDGMPALFRRDDAARLEAFGRGYSQARVEEGWQPLSSEQALALPYAQPPGYPALYWHVRRQSYELLIRLLEEEGLSPAAGPVADLGAGIGWLSHRLALAGYEVLAVDASRDDAFGLGAAAVYLARGPGFLRAQGNLEYPPLQRGRLALLIFNASLHYASDLEGTLSRAGASLQSEGTLIVLDTPIARRPRPGTGGHGDRHLGHEELEAALVRVGLRPRWLAVGRGMHWWAHQAKAWLKRGPRFGFPVVVAQRAGPTS